MRVQIFQRTVLIAVMLLMALPIYAVSGAGSKFVESKKVILDTSSAIDTLFRSFDRDDAPGCAVAVYRDGRTVFTGSYGLANLDYGIPLTDSSRFYMASVSKQVTAAAAALLVVRDELSLNDLVSDYLDDWPEWASKVRVRHLFYHTSGLPDIYDLMDISGTSLSNVMTIDDYMSVFYNGESLRDRPGASYSYTNSGYTALASLIEKITKTEFSVFVRDELLEPLGMRETHFHDDRYRIIPNRVISYAPLSAQERDRLKELQPGKRDAPTPPLFRQTYMGTFQGVGPGGLYSSLRDWQHWENLWLDDNELPEEMLELRRLMRMQDVVDADTLDYGMGLQLESWKGLTMEGHSGNFMGFKTDVRRFPEKGLALLTLCNREDANPSEKNRSLARILLADEMEAYLKPYEGIYNNEELDVAYELYVEDGALKLERRLSPRGAMSEQEKDIWRAGSWEFEFQRDEQEVITGFVVSTGRAQDVAFERRTDFR